MASFSSVAVINSPKDHATDLNISVFFFTMHSCEFVKAAKKGITKIICLGLGGSNSTPKTMKRFLTITLTCSKKQPISRSSSKKEELVEVGIKDPRENRIQRALSCLLFHLCHPTTLQVHCRNKSQHTSL